MAKVEDKGRLDYSKFDKMDTAVLEAILLADFDAPEAEQIEAEEALYIASLLAERRNIEHKDVSASMEEFFEYYYPLAQQRENLYIYDENFGSQSKVISFVQKSWRVFASAVAVLVLLLFGGTFTAYALGYEPVRNFVGRWNDEHFWFEPEPVTSEFAELVMEYAGEKKLVPEWLPENYVLNKQEIYVSEAYNCLSANFYRETNNGTEFLYLDYRFYLDDNNTPIVEKDISGVEEFKANDVKHYILEDSDVKKIIWRNGSFAGSISGNFSLEEAKKIINSIYGG